MRMLPKYLIYCGERPVHIHIHNTYIHSCHRTDLYIYITAVSRPVHTHIHNTNIHSCLRTDLYIYITCTYTCICIPVHIHVYVYITAVSGAARIYIIRLDIHTHNTYIHSFMSPCRPTYIIHTYIHISSQTCTYTHT